MRGCKLYMNCFYLIIVHHPESLPVRKLKLIIKQRNKQAREKHEQSGSSPELPSYGTGSPIKRECKPQSEVC